ncbi:GatB/YqeY domain-containing protein [Williamsia deligens]|uniref:GatB/YqeY domain-containing protein n=1 Tax=Williamsia deligens TaxID=321325 RepID=A0ABW3G6Z4_9NOCA|nr:GatB/YqeY domain-containing protein [Williamsia deligens]MCP2193312.1 hypothetical protein [Williamsia deligens]
MADAPLKQRIRTDLTAAMKARDTATTATLRMLIAAIGAEEVAGAQATELSDEQVLAVLMRESKKRGESAAIYDENGRGELADAERAEAAIIAEYLPTPLDDEGLQSLVQEAVDQVAADLGEAPGMRQMGQVMGIAKTKAAGRADGKRLSDAVRAALG